MSSAINLQTVNVGISLPSGMVSAYAGASAPDGWLFCDGSAVSRTTYAALFAALGTSHGQGDGSTTFNIPDYRGRFLRGVDGSASNDPDKAGRTAMNTGGNTGNNVGSVQSDQFGSHSHAVPTSNAGGSLSAGFQGSATSNLIGQTTQANGGNETRPKNAYVNYIIKT